MENFDEYGESQGGFGLVLAFRNGAVIIVDAGNYDELNYEIDTYKRICSNMDVKIIPYDEETYSQFKNDIVKIQEKLLQFFV